jgi:MFS family permease
MDARLTSGSERGRAARWIAFGACVLAGLTNEVSGGALSLSLRDAGAELHAGTAAMQLVMTLSKLMFGAFMLLGGLLGDTYGRRRVLGFGCLGIVVVSALGGLSASAGMLAAARALDGLANAAVGPLALALVMNLFPEEQAGRAVGLFLGLSALGIALGPLAAGSVIQVAGWRAGFAAPALVAALGGIGVRLFAPEVRGTTRRRLDGIGALSVGVALLALVFGVVGASSAGWSNPRVLQSLAVGAGAFVAFVWWERRVADPLLDLTLFRSRPLNAALLTGTLLAPGGGRVREHGRAGAAGGHGEAVRGFLPCGVHGRRRTCLRRRGARRPGVCRSRLVGASPGAGRRVGRAGARDRQEWSAHDA